MSDRKNILVCAAPKSGSSHIKLCLQRLLGYRDFFFSNDNVINPSAIQIIVGSFDGQIAHHHIAPTPCNASLMKRYSDEMAVVVTQRNLLDVVVSLKNYLEDPSVKDAWDARSSRERNQTMGRRLKDFPSIPGDDWEGLEDELKYQWMVKNSVPWYMSFFVGWASTDVPHVDVYYEDHFRDQITGVRKILDFAGIDHGGITDSQIEVVTRRKDGKFNVGRSGRGRELLPRYLINQVYECADSWGPYWGKRIREELIDR